jgi:hypothetical protein
MRVPLVLCLLAIGLLRDQGLAHHVYPGQEIQEALEAAAKDPVNKTV